METMYANRKQAAQAGQTTYKSPKPCTKGHDGFRYVSTGQCVDCMRERNREYSDALKEARKPQAERASLFTYRLHPEDHAAALAFCQSLDVQRGRVPQASQVLGAQARAPLVSATAAEVQAHRQRILGEHAVPQATNGAGHMTAEMRAQLVAAGLLTNGS